MLNWRQLKSERALCRGMDNLAERSRLSCSFYELVGLQYLRSFTASNRSREVQSVCKTKEVRLLHTSVHNLRSESAHPAGRAASEVGAFCLLQNDAVQARLSG